MAIKINGTTVVDDSRNLTNIAAATVTGQLTLNSTGAMVLPVGTTAQQPGTPTTGMIRFNTDTNKVEVYNPTSGIFGSVGGGMSQGFGFFQSARTR